MADPVGDDPDPTVKKKPIRIWLSLNNSDIKPIDDLIKYTLNLLFFRFIFIIGQDRLLDLVGVDPDPTFQKNQIRIQEKPDPDLVKQPGSDLIKFTFRFSLDL